MASRVILEELFQTAKKSPLFKGKSDDDIQKACMKHKDKDDDFIRQTIENIHKHDSEAESGDPPIAGLEGLEATVNSDKKEGEHQLAEAEAILDKLMGL